MISDEQDLDIQSAIGSKGGVEKLVRRMQSMCFQSVGHTGTIAAQALTARYKIRLVRMPIPENYYGFSMRVPQERHPVFCEASSGYDGVVEMVDDMLSRPGPGAQVGLVHLGTTKK